MNDTFGIGEAVKEMRDGKRVSRAGWNGKGMYLLLVTQWGSVETPDPMSARLPFVAMKTADDKLVPWLCSQTDLLATDWGTVE